MLNMLTHCHHAKVMTFVSTILAFFTRLYFAFLSFRLPFDHCRCMLLSRFFWTLSCVFISYVVHICFIVFITSRYDKHIFLICHVIEQSYCCHLIFSIIHLFHHKRILYVLYLIQGESLLTYSHFICYCYNCAVLFIVDSHVFQAVELHQLVVGF